MIYIVKMNREQHIYVFFFFNDTATTEIYTLSLHDALPIFVSGRHVLTKVKDTPPSLFKTTANVENSLISNGCIIEGTVKNSILSRSAVIEIGRASCRERV